MIPLNSYRKRGEGGQRVFSARRYLPIITVQLTKDSSKLIEKRNLARLPILINCLKKLFYRQLVFLRCSSNKKNIYTLKPLVKLINVMLLSKTILPNITLLYRLLERYNFLGNQAKTRGKKLLQMRWKIKNPEIRFLALSQIAIVPDAFFPIFRFCSFLFYSFLFLFLITLYCTKILQFEHYPEVYKKSTMLFQKLTRCTLKD